jgi:integrase
MGRGRPALGIGTYGKIKVSDEPEPRKLGKPAYRAKARFRDRDGVLRSVVRYGQTKGRATDALKAALAERRATSGGELGPATKIGDLATVWLEEVESSDRSPRTKEHYAYAVQRYVVPALGQVRLGEATPALCDRTLRRLADQHGPGAARTAKAVLTNMFSMAVRHDAIGNNPFREATPIKGKRRQLPRVLTVTETDDLTDRLRSDPRAIDCDLPDLVDFMLGTGARIGEALAAREGTNPDGTPVLDLEAGTWEINATVIRLKGQGLSVQLRPKTAAGWRRLALPPYVLELVRRRTDELRFRSAERTVFPSPRSNSLRDPSNTAGDLREVLDRLGYDWVTSHVFRKTVATRLDEAGLSARDIADHLGHASPSLTLDVYMGRRVVNADAARILDR